jgi:hypothetical protein
MTSSPAEQAQQSSRTDYAIVAVICVVVALVYGSMILTPPLSWDDDVNIFANPVFRDGSWLTFWRTPYFGMYIPIVDTIWDALFRVGGGAAWPFRALNLGLHVANVVLVAVLLRGLLRRFKIDSNPAFAAGVAIFALHPEQTAVVSWISGSRDLVSTTFALAAVVAFFRRGKWSELAATTLFLCGLLSKPQIAGVPLAIALFAWLFERERFKRTAIVMAGWAVLVVISAVVTSAAQASDANAVHVAQARRPILALDALGFYVMKTIWPFPLAADYGRTPAYVWEHSAGMIAMISVAVVAAAALVVWARRTRAYAVGFVWPLLLLPVLGLATFGYQNISTVADHYNYLPLAVAGAIAALAIGRSRWRDRAWALPALIIVAGGFTSWRRSDIWRDDDRFYADMLAKNPASYSAQLNLSASACDRGDWRAGLAYAKGASAHDSEDPGVLANTAYCLLKGGQVDDILRLQRNFESSRVREKLATNARASAILSVSIAGAYDKQGSPMRAFAYFCQAHALVPNDPSTAENVASIHQQMLQVGRNVECPGFVAWDRLEAIVAELR